jgi:C-terminal processing protease CtpA/Prc
MINLALFNSSSVTISGTKKDGTAFTNVSLNKAVYSSSPVLKDTVLTQGSKTIGYLAFARFSSAANAQTELSKACEKFSAAKVNNLVIDFRYNGGGYVSTAQYLINLIAPSSLAGQVMFYEQYNPLMQSGQAKILANQPLLDANNKVRYSNGKMVTYANVDYSIAAQTQKFAKNGSLEGITNIVFIVSGGTASASELVINSLKPYMNIKLVGTTTYGKPVGFFPIRLENRYDVYYSMFQTKNSAGQGEYFSGFTPDAVDTFDDATRDFGDRAENYLAKSIGYIVNNVFAVTSDKTTTIKGVSSKILDNIGDEHEFKGMIENRFKLKQ